MDPQKITPVTQRPKQGAAYLGIGLSKLYALIREGEIPTFKLGTATLIATADLDAFAARKREEALASKAA
ncbi:MAG TPA: helix-turn-helix domain-containing protein [Vulgatibacter sp.]|nr:helix-turn-helix domain-containing protein [Vulgatibacter sp.]